MIYGIGIYDGEGDSSSPYYLKWMSMIQRCYDSKSLIRDPSYEETEVCEEWLTFSNFKAWMEKQDWEGKCLDKDLKGGKYYSPQTCLFISEHLNRFWTGGRSKVGVLPGTHYEKDREKYQARLRDPETNKHRNLGRFPTEQEAHEAWKKEKVKRLSYFLDKESEEVREVILKLTQGFGPL